MKKRVIAILLVCVMAAGATGCGSSHSDNVTEESTSYAVTDETETDYDDLGIDESDWGDDSEDDVNNETVTQDDIVGVLTPFFDLVEEQALDHNYRYAPTHIGNLISYVYGSSDYNKDTPPSFFDDRLWITPKDDDYYETYFSGLDSFNGTAMEQLLPLRNTSIETYYSEVEVISSNFPEETTEFHYVRGTHSEIKMIIKVTYNACQDAGGRTEDYAYSQFFFVSLGELGDGGSKGKTPWKMTGLFIPLSAREEPEIGEDGQAYLPGLYKSREVPSEYFDLTPLTDEW